MAGNKSLTAAARAKHDEYYTQLTDIEKELRHYRKHFKGKTVFCNSDDPYESNFFKYFVLNFNRLGLKKLIATCYAGSPIAGGQLDLSEFIDMKGWSEEKPKSVPYKAIVTTVYDKDGDGGINMNDIKELFKSGENELTELEGDGDFRSPECVQLLMESDIVVTNPPFSLFREYVAQLYEYKKKFVILGNKNAVTYKEIFPLIWHNELWVGNTSMSKEIYFYVPEKHKQFLLSEKRDRSIVMHNGEYMARASAIWFTNLDIKKRHEEFIFTKHYDPALYPKYDNYDAIEVSKTADIPDDYSGVMGVPISFMDKYNPDIFLIVGWSRHNDQNMDGGYWKGGKSDATINGKEIYRRILIRNKHPEEPREKR